jgi:uncharacterized membrane protein
LAAWGVIALLIAVFPTHVYMYQNPKANGVTAMGFDFKDAITITTYVLGLPILSCVINIINI